MRSAARTFVTALVVLALPAAALHATEVKPVAAKPGSAKLTSTTPDQLSWVNDPGDPAVKTATVWGDMAKGPHGAFHKFPAGWAAPLHTHTADLRLVVMSGTVVVAGEDGKDIRLPAGSYLHQPAGVKHVTKCDAASECLIFVTASAKFDLIPAETKK